LTERINCGKCNFVLYWGESIKDRMFMRWSEETFLAKYGDKCPNCGVDASLKSVKITYEN